MHFLYFISLAIQALTLASRLLAAAIFQRRAIWSQCRAARPHLLCLLTLVALSAAVLLPRVTLAHAPITTTVQFDREVVRILDNHCVMCHAEKGPAFPLVTYEQTYAARWKIRQSVLDRHMPPWPAVAGYGDFTNSNELTQREIDFLVSWAESFGPRNNGQVYTGVAATSTTPKAIEAHPDFDRWPLGTPDLLIPVQHNVIETKLPTDRWLRALDFKPSDRRTIHSVTFTIKESGQWLGTWTPWQSIVTLPSGLAFQIPKGAHILAEIHSATATSATTGAAPGATPSSPASAPPPALPSAAGSSSAAASSTAGPASAANRSPAPGRSSASDTSQAVLGLYFATGSERPISTLTLNPKPTSSAPTLTATTQLTADLTVISMQPQLTPGVQTLEIAARAPTGATQVLLFAKDIPSDWPTPYTLKRPVTLSKGTTLTVTEHFNPAPILPASPTSLASPTPSASPAPSASPTPPIFPTSAPVLFATYPGSALPTPSVPGAAASSNLTPYHELPTPAKRFQLTGTIKSVDRDNSQLVVQHAPIPGLMGAMTMTYPVERHEDLTHLKAGDTIHSDVIVKGSATYLEHIQVTK
jgi:Cu/Ag efflux protein CusF/cytochrome c5